MLRKSFVPMFMSLFITGITGAAFASPPASGHADTPERAAKLGETLSVLHAVGQWSINLSEMADKRAKSDLVKNYADAMARANSTTDTKLVSIAQRDGIDIVPLNPQSEEGRSLLDRI